MFPVTIVLNRSEHRLPDIYLNGIGKSCCSLFYISKGYSTIKRHLYLLNPASESFNGPKELSVCFLYILYLIKCSFVERFLQHITKERNEFRVDNM